MRLKSFTAELRLARAEDLPALSELCLRSKAHWGYDAAFIEACREDLTFHTSDLDLGEVWMADGPVAVLQVIPTPPVAELRHVFLDPSLIGKGFGRDMVDFAVSRAKALKCSKMTLSSEPKAAGFYEAMGGRLTVFE